MMLAATLPLAAPAGHGDPRLLPAGTRLDEFEILRPLGVGGFGIVYLALDHSLLRHVALKEFMPGELAARAPAGSVGPRADDCAEQFHRLLDSFFNEARLLASFNHPALVRVYRFWKANGTAYMAMQYCPGSTLAQARSAMRSAPDERWLRAFVDPILDALERLHDAGVFHRDVSPDNILLLPDGRPILLDFGSARRVVGRGSRSLTAVLKPNFAPIEQYGNEAGMPQGAWTDLYALGATVDFMLTGEPPTPAVLRVVNDVRRPLAAAGRGVYPGVGANFLAAIDWTLAVAPTDRPQSVDALRRALGDDAGRTATPDRKPPGRGVLAACLLATVGVLGLAAWSVVSTGHGLASSPSTSISTPAPATGVAPASIAAARPSPASPHSIAVLPPAAAAATVVQTTAASFDAAPPRTQRPAPAKRPTPAAKTPATSPTSPTTVAEALGRGPGDVCAGRNFISRAVCVSRQCEAAEWRTHPDCADARRIEEQRQRRLDR